MTGLVSKKIGIASVVFGLALASVWLVASPAHAGSASCNATYTTSTSSHTITNSSCLAGVQARAQRYYSSGAWEWATGPLRTSFSAVNQYPGVFLSNRQGRGQPASGTPISAYKVFQNGSGSTTFNVSW